MLGFINNFYGWETFFDRLVAASWQGGLILAIAWLVSRYGRRLPATVRVWIWRIAYVKFVVVLLFGGLLQIPILPSSTNAEYALLVSNEIPEFIRLSTNMAPTAEFTGLDNGELAPAPVDPVSVSLPWSSGLSILTRSLFGFWILGCAVSIVLVMRDCLRIKRLVHSSRPIDDLRLIRRYRILRGRFKLSDCPSLASTTGISSPVLVGLFQTTILIPEPVLKSSDREELGLILAHELAHFRRRDLLWNWLPVLVRTCFFFHPLVWLTQSRFSLDQEIACDQLALTRTNSRTKSYSNMLVKISAIASYPQTSSFAVLGVASSYTTLKLRILEMYQFNQKMAISTRFASAIAIIATLLFILPVGLIAQQESKETTGAGITVSSSANQGDQADGPKGQSTVSASNQTQSTRNSTGGSPNDRGNVSVSVSKDGKSESLQIEWSDEGRVDITYSTSTGGDTVVKKYNLKNIDELAGKNKNAFGFYKAHVTTSNRGANSRTVGTTSQEKGARRTRSSRIRSSRTGATSSTPQNSQSQNRADSSSSSAWQTSSMTNNNGAITRTQDSGTTGNGVVGAGSKAQMVQQIMQMINQTNNPQMKQQLQQMLNQIRQ